MTPGTRSPRLWRMSPNRHKRLLDTICDVSLIGLRSSPSGSARWRGNFGSI
jgi:hypothetical protein